MKIGLTIFPTQATLQPAELAREAEARGFESLWLPEHSHIPVDQKTPWGGRTEGGVTPSIYAEIYEPFIALAAAASVTKRILLGTSVCLVPQRDPLWLAKQVATIDRISQGRFLFGIGYGWNREELENHRIAYRERREILAEAIRSMQRIWTDDEATYSGEYVRFSQMRSWPKPVQRPHPPIVLGAEAGPRTAAHIAEFCDGWIPSATPDVIDLVTRGQAEISQACVRVGRDPATVETSVWSVKADRGALDQLAGLGVQRVILRLPSKDPGAVLSALDRYSMLLS